MFIKYTQEQLDELVAKAKNFKAERRPSNIEDTAYFDDKSFWEQLKQENPVVYVELFDTIVNQQPTSKGYVQELAYYLDRQLNPETPDTEKLWNHSDFYKAIYGDLVDLRRTKIKGNFTYAGAGTRFKSMTFIADDVANFEKIAQALLDTAYENVKFETMSVDNEGMREYRAHNDETSLI